MRDNQIMPSSHLPSVQEDRAWRFDAGTADLAKLEELTTAGPWNGPLIISMPRTGSTLLGTIFLLLRDRDGEHVFDRYIHEPVAPVFWEDRPIESILQITGGLLTERDIIQESAYQFTSKEIARWFLRRARHPIGFVMRHPLLAWPSRWRIMLREWLARDPDSSDALTWRAALDSNDFTNLGNTLTTRVTQPDNGWYSFISLVDLCQQEGIEFTIIDNARFRAGPDRILAQLCQRWGHEYDEAMTSWQDLSEARPRVVMSDLAAGPEYDWYYAATLGSSGGIVREDREPLDADRFPEILRGESDDHLTIDEAVVWYEMLLDRPETLV